MVASPFPHLSCFGSCICSPGGGGVAGEGKQIAPEVGRGNGEGGRGTTRPSLHMP